MPFQNKQKMRILLGTCIAILAISLVFGCKPQQQEVSVGSNYEQLTIMPFGQTATSVAPNTDAFNSTLAPNATNATSSPEPLKASSSSIYNQLFLNFICLSAFFLIFVPNL